MVAVTGSSSGAAAATPLPLSKDHKLLVSNCGFKVGEKVMVTLVGNGVIRYLGPLKAKERISKNIYVGVELDEAKGKNSGTFEVGWLLVLFVYCYAKINSICFLCF